MIYAFIYPDGRVREAHNVAWMDYLPSNAIEMTQAQFDDRFNLRHDGANWVHDPLPDNLVALRAIQAARLRQEARDEAINDLLASKQGKLNGKLNAIQNANSRAAIEAITWGG